MHDPIVHHTLDIFERLYNHVREYIPVDLRHDVEAALDQVQHNFSLTTEEVEQTMIAFGKKVWPYRKAFAEFLASYEGQLGEKFFIAKISRTTKKRYTEYTESGGSFRALHQGTPAGFFSSEQRVELCQALIETGAMVKKFTLQAIKSVDQAKFEARVEEFSDILVGIETRLDGLRAMAGNEQEHPRVAEEIRTHVESFEYGLCFLGQEMSYEAVCNAEEHFEGRRKELCYRGSV